MVEQCLNDGYQVNETDDNGRSVLQLAVNHFEQPRDIIELLVENGASIMQSEGPHSSPLVDAVEGSLDILGYLLDRAAELESKENYKRLASGALARTAKNGDLECARFLLGRGARPLPNSCVLENAAAAGRNDEELVRLFLDMGANLNAQGGYYGGPLEAAAREGKTRIVQMLIDAGVDVHAQGGVYGNALNAARERGYPEVVAILEPAMKKQRVLRVMHRRGLGGVNAATCCGHLPWPVMIEFNSWSYT